MFIRTVAAFNTAAQVRLQRMPIIEAADNTLAEIAAIGGDGGLIVLDAKGNYAMRFNTRGMFRGTIGSDGIACVGVLSEAETSIRIPLCLPLHRPPETVSGPGRCTPTERVRSLLNQKFHMIKKVDPISYTQELASIIFLTLTVAPFENGSASFGGPDP